MDVRDPSIRVMRHGRLGTINRAETCHSHIGHMLAVRWTCKIRVCIRVMRHGRLGTINWAVRLATITLDTCHVQTIITSIIIRRCLPWPPSVLACQCPGLSTSGPPGSGQSAAISTPVDACHPQCHGLPPHRPPSSSLIPPSHYHSEGEKETGREGE